MGGRVGVGSLGPRTAEVERFHEEPSVKRNRVRPWGIENNWMWKALVPCVHRSRSMLTKLGRCSWRLLREEHWSGELRVPPFSCWGIPSAFWVPQAAFLSLATLSVPWMSPGKPGEARRKREGG